MSLTLQELSKAKLDPVQLGKVAGEPIEAEQLWKEAPALIFVIRRPGCILCRENAKEISTRYKDKEFNGIKLYGVIKEVAPVSGAETDEELGVGEFQTKYFENHPVYRDNDKKFYKYLGEKSLLSQPWHSWNPFTLYSDFVSMTNRLKSKGVEGNLKGEGLLKGGIIVVSPSKGVVYRHEEVSGSEMPYDDIFAAARSAINT